MNWIEQTGHSFGIQAIFSELPELNSVLIHEVILHGDGPSISVRLDLNEFPTSPPQKWIDRKVNTVQITLMLLCVEDLSVRGWGIDNVGDITIQSLDDGLRFHFKSQAAEIECGMQLIELVDISGYMNSMRT
ncbi:hypothetical protein KOR42_55530 [Thalassoglobus neptunius]|uniref:Immunity protein 50 n=1 Tax=Thalassoglobus neptunius TaxID=1938619 RepID=A0A5C5UTH8_9PLAN|nr:Imm50 family immunity protein [Thalassoglobus neptunius]TWT29159.1 hypothetical protein KOR42_55530 [Thalassoglobus neptunius]